MKVVTRHIWQPYLDFCEELRHTNGMKELYDLRKETIERNFGTAKEHHAMRYTQERGKAKMSMKVGLTFACMNMKKLVNVLSKGPDKGDNCPKNHILSALFTRLSDLTHLQFA